MTTPSNALIHINDPNRDHTDQRVAALASFGESSLACFISKPLPTLPATALAARSAVLQAPHPVQKRITYTPLQREAEILQKNIQSKLFGMEEGCTAYGSTTGDWCKVPTNKRVILPPGCEPRRSKRLQQKVNELRILKK